MNREQVLYIRIIKKVIKKVKKSVYNVMRAWYYVDVKKRREIKKGVLVRA